MFSQQQPHEFGILHPIIRIPVKLFRRRMQNYATLCDKIIQHYMQHCVIPGEISPHIRRHIVVNDCFCGDNWYNLISM